jgi:hypothetical protein
MEDDQTSIGAFNLVVKNAKLVLNAELLDLVFEELLDRLLQGLLNLAETDDARRLL